MSGKQRRTWSDAAFRMFYLLNLSSSTVRRSPRALLPLFKKKNCKLPQRGLFCCKRKFIRVKCFNPSPAEPGHALPLQTLQIQISWLLKKPTDLDLYCLPFSMWNYMNIFDKLIWLAENWKWAWHLNLFSMTRIKTPTLASIWSYLSNDNRGTLQTSDLCTQSEIFISKLSQATWKYAFRTYQDSEGSYQPVQA